MNGEVGENIARDLNDYVEGAVELANDLPRRVALRAHLRDKMAASPLRDGEHFVANFVPGIEAVWQEMTAAGQGKATRPWAD